jgi:hypothetical protein
MGGGAEAEAEAETYLVRFSSTFTFHLLLNKLYCSYCSREFILYYKYIDCT